jgi:hypothetical protein
VIVPHLLSLDEILLGSRLRNQPSDHSVRNEVSNELDANDEVPVILIDPLVIWQLYSPCRLEVVIIEVGLFCGLK